MLNLLNAEFYKLFHSRYFWGIVAFNLFLSSVLGVVHFKSSRKFPKNLLN